ncbi:MAG: glycerophosphodiester phosphodiesterase [Bdellovibrio sp.]|nr:glycerophosphodiester phosphodiesterase [Bdellovibrio sp.]
MYFLLPLFVGLGFLIFRHLTWKALSWPEKALMPPPYQGHRGYWQAGAQENTMSSFQAAARRGLKMIELDVQLSKDEVPVVFHDYDLKRLGGLEKVVHECTVQELKNAADVCTLEDVILATDVPRLINIELKTKAIFDNVLEVKVAEVIRRHRCADRVLLSSFNPLSLRRLSRLLPEVPRALLASKEDEPENKIYLRQMWLAPYAQVHLLHLDHNYIDVASLKKWQKRDIPVALWTVNDAEKAEMFLKAGALSIITDSLGNAGIHQSEVNRRN